MGDLIVIAVLIAVILAQLAMWMRAVEHACRLQARIRELEHKGTAAPGDGEERT